MKPALLLVALALAAGRAMTVVVEEAKVRKTKAFFAPVVSTLKEGDSVKVGALEGGWYKVSGGWLHQSALAGGKAKAGGSKWEGSDEAQAEEVTLAGKGFNEDVEKRYKGERSDVDFEAVDRMEARKVSEKELLKFMKEGQTLPQEAR